MKSIIEDFDHIASRLTEIEQEKHTQAMAPQADESEDWTAFTFTASLCAPLVTIADDDIFCGD